jgi:hypothetical protein
MENSSFYATIRYGSHIFLEIKNQDKRNKYWSSVFAEPITYFVLILLSGTKIGVIFLYTKLVRKME